MKVNDRFFEIHKGNNSPGGIFTYEEFITGKIVKVNKKSTRVHLTHIKRTTNGKVTEEQDMDEMATFTFWKRIENRQFGKNAGKTVDIYKNSKYGIIEIAH